MKNIKINKLTITFRDGSEKTYDFDHNFQYISSNDNQLGKTSRFKSILFALGFNISFSDPFASKIKGTLVELVITEKDKTDVIVFDRKFSSTTGKNKRSDKLNIYRKEELLSIGSNHLIDLSDGKYIVDLNYAYKEVVGFSFDELEAILKCMIISQDEGWWNGKLEGTLISGIKFSVYDFLVTLMSEDNDGREKLKEYISELKQIQVVKKEVSGMIRVLADFKTYNGLTVNGDDSRVANLKKQLSEVKIAKGKLDSRKWLLESMERKNHEFLEFIERSNWKIKIKNESYDLTANMIDTSLDEFLVSQRLSELNDQISELESQEQSISDKIAALIGQETETRSKHYEKMMNLIKTRSSITNDEIVFLTNERDFYTRRIQTLLAMINEVSANALVDVEEKASHALNEMESSNTKMSFIHDYRHNGSSSGVEKVKLSLSLLYALREIVKVKMDLNLPIIVDAPGQQEMVGTKTATKVYDFLAECSIGAQLIVFSNAMENDADKNKFKFDSKILIEKM